MAATAVFPKKNQAIVLETNDRKTILEKYTIAGGNIVPPKNISFVSKSSNKRICFYIFSKDLVDKIVSDNFSVTRKSVEIRILRLIKPSRRILLFIVCASIPYSILL